MLSYFYEDAKVQLEDILQTNNIINISSSNSPISNQGIIESTIIDHIGAEDSDRANMQVALRFKEYAANADGVFDQTTRVLNLVMLTSEGDKRWSKRMREYVWKGKYPESIAIDRETGTVYLVFITQIGFELLHYSEIALDKLEAALLTLNNNAPYYIYIEDTAMFDVLDGSEGYNHLYRNTYIMLNGVQQTKISKKGISE